MFHAHDVRPSRSDLEAHTILVDERWQGRSGIGRYADEVVPRLSVDWTGAGLSGNPVDIKGFLGRSRAQRQNRGALLYSPGYMATLGSSRQLLTVHDLIHLQLPFLQRVKYEPYYERVLKPIIRETGAVITVSETSANSIEEWLSSPGVDVVNCGNGLSASFVPQGEAAQLAEGPYLLFVGNLKPHKNFPVLLEMMQQVSDLILVAVTPEPHTVIALSERFGVRSKVRAVSGLSDSSLAALYRGALALLFPSLLEGFGLPALECVACGTPVIYSESCPTVGEVVGQNGVEVRSSDSSTAEAWSSALRELPATVSIDLSKYSWDRVSAKVSAVLTRSA